MKAGRFLTISIALLVAGPQPRASGPIVDSKFELFVTDVDEATRFYSTLGFTRVERKPDGYTTLRSGGTVVALSPVPSWLPLRWLAFLRQPPLGTEIVFYSDRIEELRAALETAGYGPGEIELRPWGNRDFRVSDWEGYYVRVSEGRAVPIPAALPTASPESLPEPGVE
jgi:catechol 2,3-dioxygenase-like lactoylglutathione lyase family enzyme